MSEPRYEIRIQQRVGDALMASFDQLESEQEHVETVVRGPRRDQAEFGAALEQIRSLGLELLEGRRLAGASGQP